MKERREDFGQMRVPVEGEKLRIPSSLGKKYPWMVSFLEEQKLWKQGIRGKERAVFFDGGEKEFLVFNPFNWQIETAAFDLNELPQSNFCGLVIISDQEEIEEVPLYLGLQLRPHAPFFVFEKREEEVAKNRQKETKSRLILLENWGLVERKILIQPSRKKEEPVSQFLVWRARMPAEWRPRKPVNLIDEGSQWRRVWIEKLIKKAAAEYRKEGWVPLNAYEIGERLRNSVFPLDDISRLKLGFGFYLEVSCGCCWQVTINGDWVRNKDCGDFDCDGIPRKPSVSRRGELAVKEKLSSERIVYCFDCGGEMYWDRRAARGGRYVCPHCGCD